MCADSVKDKFLDIVKTQVAKTFGDKPKESPFYSRMINVNHFNRINKLLDSTKGKLVYKPNDENDREDCYVAPHVFEIEQNDALMSEEVIKVKLINFST
jgi:acyl-CoA reductase-like NAD-dependent aldehyde dehydrogenase